MGGQNRIEKCGMSVESRGAHSKPQFRWGVTRKAKPDKSPNRKWFGQELVVVTCPADRHSGPVRGSKAARRPRVWKLRVYVGDNPTGALRFVTRTLDTTDGNPSAKPGSGSRMADRELARMVADVGAGRPTVHATTVEQLLERWFNHLESLGRSLTTLREYRSIARRTVIPALGSVRLDKLTAAITGCRRGELCGLRWGDLDTATNTLTVTRSVCETAGGGWGSEWHQDPPGAPNRARRACRRDVPGSM
jgi:hypothetical protein